MTTHTGITKGLVSAFILLAGASTLFAAPTPLTTVRITSGLSRPLFVTAPIGDTARIFVAEQFSGTTGRVRIVNLSDNSLNATPYLSITGVNATNEEGLLGLAFHPDFYAAPGNVNRGAFFVYYTSGGNNHVVRYTATGQDPTADTADATSSQTVIDFSHPGQSNHNGGWIAFGPDGYLYIATGDGGSGCDPPGNAQNVDSLLGKIHRINVNADQNPGSATVWGYLSPSDNPYFGTAHRNEIWEYGVRNPFRDSFDRLTGDLYIGDVGQNFREEISFAPAGVSNINFGWDVREGFQCSSGGASGCTSTCSTAGRTDPIWDLVWQSGYAIIGGYVYRGNLIPDSQGIYFFAEYSTGRIWSFKYVGVPLTTGNVTERTSELVPTGPVPGLVINNITSFGEDANGEMYIVDQGGGEIYKIVVNCAGSSIVIQSQPTDQTVTAGETATFSVGVSGSRGLVTYTWKRGGVVVGSNSPALQIPNSLCYDGGSYTCTISDQCNTIVTNTVNLTVDELPPSPILGDIDLDSVVDMNDMDILVNVLVGVDTDAGHVSRANVDGSGCADGLDIETFTDLLLP